MTKITAMVNEVAVVNQIQLPQEDRLELVRLPRFVIYLVVKVEIIQCEMIIYRFEVLIIVLLSAGIFN